jgi:hypothetical protein
MICFKFYSAPCRVPWQSRSAHFPAADVSKVWDNSATEVRFTEGDTAVVSSSNWTQRWYGAGCTPSCLRQTDGWRGDDPICDCEPPSR